MPDQFFFVFQPQVAGRGSAGDNERLRLQPLIIRFHPDVFVASIEIGYLGVRKARTKFLSLPMHVEDELGPVDSIREAGIILHQRGSRELTAGLPPFQHQRIQVRARGVNRRRQSGATASSNDHLLHQ